jgi:hypothetical protein
MSKETVPNIIVIAILLSSFIRPNGTISSNVIINPSVKSMVVNPNSEENFE